MTIQSLPDTPSRSDIASAAARRAFDLVLSGAALLVLAPVLALIALAVVLESGRPVLFSQLRLGLHGRPFRMYKFRKFHVTCDSAGCPLTLEGDARLTRVGRFLLATKLDELPQLWNVLKGEMSIVGPRPESLAFADCFSHGFERVLQYKPGILGPNQIIFRNESQFYPDNCDPTQFYRQILFPKKARIDLDYFRGRTLGSDLMLVVRGVLAVCGWVPSSRAMTAGADDRTGKTKSRQTVE